METKTFVRAFLLLTVFASHYASVFAQYQNANWVFGVNQGMDFGSGAPTFFESSCNASGIYQPAVISDEDGNLVCYTDGDKVYNSNNEVIQNGDLSLSPENLIVPAPGQADKYYLFRSFNNQLRYCIIDMSLNNGDGGIESGNIDILVESTLCQVTATMHPNGVDVWIITSDNSNGNTDDIRYTSYLLNGEGLTEVDSVQNYYLFGGWYSAPDDLRISPDCSKLATTYKGHYLVLCRFNNEDGDLYDLLESNIDMQTSFGSSDLDQIEFSPNSNLLYTLGDQYVIKQYNLEEWNASTIASTVSPITNLNYSDVWTDIKLGPDGILYLHNVMDDQIDVISNPDDPGDMIEIEEGVYPNLSLSNFFPNTANYACSSFIDISVEHQYECLGDNTEFWYSLIQDPDSVYWDFGDPDSGVNNFSTLDNPIHVFSAVGPYVVLFTYYMDGQEFTIEHPVNIYSVAPLNLPNNVIVCEGETITLDAGPGAEVYAWSTGADTQTITINQGGQFWVEVSNGTCMVDDTTFAEYQPDVVMQDLSDIILCEGELFTVDPGIEWADDIFWSNGSLDPIIFVSLGGVYSVVASNVCSEEEQEIEVTYVQFPSVVLPPDISICTIEPVVIEATYTGGEFEWSTGENTPQISVEESGTYSITVSVGECSTSDEINVTIYDYIPLDDIMMPNIFTPDANGKNEVFRPFLKTNPEFELCSFGGLQIDMNIYDRWGNLLEEDVCSWSGKLSGGDTSEDAVFYYILDIRAQCDAQDDEVKKEGYVHVVRE